MLTQWYAITINIMPHTGINLVNGPVMLFIDCLSADFVLCRHNALVLITIANVLDLCI